ncbi:HAD family hydrolase [Teredinibacter purpureus]|uniref:HAD family hydrolase n=1 Tax=Teredinibacter purpureus TaxID=2731756 RepID=UPI0005F84E4D|nr:HAD family phosphatase [Teredinibacter purpureus]
MTAISTLLFDLGGVLIELDGPPIKKEWINETLSHEENWQRWMSSSYVKNFETGKITAEDFVTGVVKELSLNTSEDTFRQAFVEWPKALFPGVTELLCALKKNYNLAFFSNTSSLHLPRLLNELQLADYFDYTYASYEIGHFKPDVSGFHYVSADMGVSPESILFIDDNQINIQGALAAGLQAQKAVGFDDVLAVLTQHNCL